MEIYLDIFFLENIILNLIILFETSKMSKMSFSKINILIASFISTTCSLFLNIININLGISAILKILVSILVCLICFIPKNVRCFIKVIVSFYLVSIILGGSIYFLISIFLNEFQPERISANAKTIVIVSFGILDISIRKMWKIWKETIKQDELICNLKIEIKKEKIFFNAFIDTGNNAIDIITGLPIIFVQKNRFDFFSQISNGINQRREFHQIEVKTINGIKQELIGTIANRIVIINNSKKYHLRNCMICFVNGELDDNNRFDAIIGYNLLLESTRG